MKSKTICSYRRFVCLFLLTIATLITGPVFLFAQDRTEMLTRQAAVDLVVNEIVQPFTLDHHVVVFLGTEIIQPGSTIWPYFDEEERRTITKPTWFAWINDHPRAYFVHDTRYVYIDASTGEYDIQTAHWWPVLDGESLWMTDAEWHDKQLVIYANINIK